MISNASQPHLPLLSPSLTLLQPYWPSCWSSYSGQTLISGPLHWLSLQSEMLFSQTFMWITPLPSSILCSNGMFLIGLILTVLFEMEFLLPPTSNSPHKLSFFHRTYLLAHSIISIFVVYYLFIIYILLLEYQF